jgi:hypothetical protein
MTIGEAHNDLELIEVHDERLLRAADTIDDVLCDAKVKDGPTLWLVVEEKRQDHLAGVLSPFKLM